MPTAMNEKVRITNQYDFKIREVPTSDLPDGVKSRTNSSRAIQIWRPDPHGSLALDELIVPVEELPGMFTELTEAEFRKVCSKAQKAFDTNSVPEGWFRGEGKDATKEIRRHLDIRFDYQSLAEEAERLRLHIYDPEEDGRITLLVDEKFSAVDCLEIAVLARRHFDNITPFDDALETRKEVKSNVRRIVDS